MVQRDQPPTPNRQPGSLPVGVDAGPHRPALLVPELRDPDDADRVVPLRQARGERGQRVGGVRVS
jgi:hypothetical protein